MFKGVCVGGGGGGGGNWMKSTSHQSTCQPCRLLGNSAPLLLFTLFSFFAPSSLSVTALTGGLFLRGEADFFSLSLS